MNVVICLQICGNAKSVVSGTSSFSGSIFQKFINNYSSNSPWNSKTMGIAIENSLVCGQSEGSQLDGDPLLTKPPDSIWKERAFQHPQTDAENMSNLQAVFFREQGLLMFQVYVGKILGCSLIETWHYSQSTIVGRICSILGLGISAT